LFIASLVLFLPGAGGYFLADDFVLLSWTRVDSPGGVAAFFDPNTFWFYRPLVKVVYWLSQSLFDLRAWPLHLLSLALHGANTYLLYKLVVRQAGVAWPAGLSAGLLFLANPHHAEAVSWIAAVGDLMAALCILIALILFQRYLDGGSTLGLLGCLVLFAVGLLSRETAIMLPPLMLLLAVLLPGRGGAGPQARPRLLLALGAHGVLLALYLAVQLLGRGAGQTGTARGGLEFRPLNLDSILLAILDYVHGLVPGGALLVQQPLEMLRVLVWVEWGLLLLLLAVLWRARQQLMLFGLLWLLLTPLLFVFFSGPADRYFYLPSMGYAIFLGALLSELPGWVARLRVPSLASRAVVALIAGALFLTQAAELSTREGVWRSAGQATGGVFNDMVQAVPEPRDYSAFFFTGLPMFMDGVPVFQNGVQEGVQLIYGNRTITAAAVSCDHLRLTELPRYSHFFRFKGDGAEPFAAWKNAGDWGARSSVRNRITNPYLRSRAPLAGSGGPVAMNRWRRRHYPWAFRRNRAVRCRGGGTR
jgi:4-amino-4-deoxy-L-arabinose transferase-like glycosyltransferase